MNYYTIVTPEAGLPCTAEEAAAIQELLADEQEDSHGFTFVFEDGEGYLEADEVGEAGRLMPGSHGGTAFRIMADGRLVERIETWPT